MPDGKWVSKANLQTFWQMIRSKVLPTMIGDTVTTWLTEHVDPVGSAVVVDNTLTIEGAAADAKKTGDEISGLKEDLSESVSDLKNALNQDKTAPQGYILTATNSGNGSEWSPVGLPTDEQTAQAVTEWLDEHPEATTTVQDSAVTTLKLADDAVTEPKVNDDFLLLIKNNYVTPQMFGAKADGVTDDSDALQSALYSGKVVFVPEGVYLTSKPLYVEESVIGIAGPRMGGKGSVIKADFTGDYILRYVTSGKDGIGAVISNLSLDCDSKSSGFYYGPQAGTRPPLVINNVSVWNHNGRGISIAPLGSVSRCAMLNNISITGGTDSAECNVYFSANAADCSMTNFVLMYCKKGILNRGGGLRLVNGHIYIGKSGVSDLDAYYEASMCVESYADVIGTNIYIDSALQGWVQRSGIAELGNIYSWYDHFADNASNKNATVIRAVDATTTIHVSNLCIGGNRSAIGKLCSDHVVVDNFILKGWTELSTAINGYSYNQMPFMSPNSKQSYLFEAVSNAYTVVAAIYISTTKGVCAIRLSRDQMAADIIIKSTGTSDITVTRQYVYGLDALPVWYKVVDNYVYLYTVPYRPIYVETMVSNTTVCGIYLKAFPSLLITQSDTSGLTYIPN